MYLVQAIEVLEKLLSSILRPKGTGMNGVNGDLSHVVAWMQSRQVATH